MIAPMKTKTRKRIAKAKMKAPRQTRTRHTTTKMKAKGQRKPKAQRKVKTHIAAPTAGDGKLLKMAPRPTGAEKKINVRFATEQDYLMVAAEAAAEGMSVNRFIVTQAMAKCGSKITA
jgi:hypothetical protein